MAKHKRKQDTVIKNEQNPQIEIFSQGLCGNIDRSLQMQIMITRQ